MGLDRELARAIEMASEAGRRVLEIYDREYEVEFKAHHEPVTLADRLANQIIVRGLGEAFPR